MTESSHTRRATSESSVSSPTRREVVRQLIADWRHAAELPLMDPEAATALRCCADELEAALGEPSPTKIQGDCFGSTGQKSSEDGAPVSASEQLARLLDDAGIQVQFGLRAQGKFETVGRMLKEGATDKEIGKAIGWCGATAVRWYALESALRASEGGEPARPEHAKCPRCGGIGATIVLEDNGDETNWLTCGGCGEVFGRSEGGEPVTRDPHCPLHSGQWKYPAGCTCVAGDPVPRVVRGRQT